MNKKGLRLAACALSGTILLTGMNLTSSASGIASILPVAGLSLILGEGTDVNAIKTEVEKNRNASTLSQNSSENTVTIEEEKDATTAQPTISGNEVEENAGVADNTEDKTSVSVNEVEEREKEDNKYYSTLVIARVNDYVNVRSLPSEDGEIVGKLYDKSVGEFISEKDGWYEIKSGNVTGFVKAEYVVTGDEAIQLAREVGKRLATVTTTTLFVRQEASTDSPVLGMVPIEDQLSVVEEMEGWVKVSIEEGEGYVSSEFVTLSTEFVKAESKAEEEARLKKEEQEREAARAAAAAATAKSSKKSSAQSSTSEATPAPAPAPSGGSSTGSAVANFAVQFVGNPYVYGGTSLTNGADCSGFVMSVYQNFGVSLPHSSGALRSKGYDVGGIGNAQPGDLVCYSGHVGIYIGGGNIVHASTAKTGIKISNASYRPILSVRRIF